MNINRYSQIGIICAPLIPALSLSLASPGLGVTSSNLSSVLVWTVFLYFPSAFVTAIFGIPAYNLLKHFNLICWWSVTIVGFLSGAIAMSIFTGFRWLNNGQDNQGLFAWSVLGAVTAYVIWFFWQLTHKK